MANDDDMLRLMEQLLPHLQKCLVSNTPVIGPPESFVPSGHITKELFIIICAVFKPKRHLARKRWEYFFVTNFSKAVSSHEMYLRHVMFACDIEIELSDNVFDKLLKVCALVITLNILTLKKTGLNFCELTLDIFKVFYKCILKRTFYRQGGFNRFKEYLQTEYLAFQRHFEYYSVVPVANRSPYISNKLQKLGEMFGNVPYQLENITHDDITKNIRCQKLAKEVLLTTKLKLPSLSSSKELKVRILANNQNKAVRSEKSKTTTVDDSKREKTGIVIQPSLNYEAIDSVEDKANKAWCDNIVRIVTMYNNSKRSEAADANLQIQKDASKILEQLKDTFTSLIQILDEYDEE